MTGACTARQERRWSPRGLAIAATAAVLAVACGSTTERDTVQSESVTTAASPGGDDQVAATIQVEASDTPAADDQAASDPLLVATEGFCRVSLDLGEAIEVGDFFAASTPHGPVDAWAETVAARIDAVVVAAPNPELAAGPQQLQVAWDQIRSGFPPEGTFADFVAASTAAEAATVLASVKTANDDYLTGPCGLPTEALEGNAEGLAAQFLAGQPEDVASGEDRRPGEGYLGPVRQVLDDVSGIWLTVPEGWVGLASGGSPERWIVVAPDVDAYNTTWEADGVSIQVTDVGPGNAWSGEREPDEPAWQDCIFVSADDYDDGVHRGTLTWFDGCSDTDTEALVLLATIADGSLEIVLEMQIVDGDRSLVELVLASFEV